MWSSWLDAWPAICKKSSFEAFRSWECSMQTCLPLFSIGVFGWYSKNRRTKRSGNLESVIAFAFSDGLCQNLCLPSSNRDTTYTRAHWQCVEYTVVQVCSITQSTNRTVPSVTPLGCRGTTNRVAWLRIRAPSHGKVSREWVYHSCHSSDLEGQQ